MRYKDAWKPCTLHERNGFIYDCNLCLVQTVGRLIDMLDAHAPIPAQKTYLSKPRKREKKASPEAKPNGPFRP